MDRLANEYKIYDELDNRFFEYQKIALQYYDLDILDVPNNDPSRVRQEAEAGNGRLRHSLFPVRASFLDVSQSGSGVSTTSVVGWSTF